MLVIECAMSAFFSEAPLTVRLSTGPEAKLWRSDVDARLDSGSQTDSSFPLLPL